MNLLQQLIIAMSIKLQWHLCDQPRRGWRTFHWQLPAQLMISLIEKYKAILQPCGETSCQLITNVE